MRNLILGLALVAGSTAAFAQGTFYFDNGTPSSSSLSASTGGAYFINGVELSGSDTHAFYGTIVANGFTLAVNTLLDVGGNGELLADSGNAFSVALVPGGSSTTITITAWEDLSGSGVYSAADPKGSGTFTQTLGGALNPPLPPGLPANLTSMPAINLVVPEPGSFALAGLGGAVLLIFRRRK
jgi:hypothetical protein